MSDQPLVSVIIPVYNGEKYVKACIESMLSQSYKNLEVIVVNDGSHDNSGEIASSYPVKLINLEQNRGLSAARNTGIDAASGKYVHFMDVDDEINSDFFREMVLAIVSTGADIACGGMINQAKSYKTWTFKKQEVAETTDHKLKLTYVGKWGYVWRYLFRREFLLERNLRFEVGRFIEDLVFSLPAVYYSNKVVAVPGAYYTYFQQENSIMNNRDKAHREKRHNDWKHARNFRKEFAKKHNLRIPGVTTGRIAYIIRKLFK